MHKHLRTSYSIPAPAEAVWQLLRHGGGVEQWLPIVTACRVDGDRRTCETDGGTLHETIVRSDDHTRTFVYRIDEQALFPAEGITGTMRVEPAGESRCTLHWDVEMDLLDADAWQPLKTQTEQLYAASAQQLGALANAPAA